MEAGAISRGIERIIFHHNRLNLPATDGLTPERVVTSGFKRKTSKIALTRRYSTKWFLMA
jgi:hypothetical protein